MNDNDGEATLMLIITVIITIEKMIKKFYFSLNC